MKNDETKEAVNFLFEDSERQERRFREADQRIKSMLSEMQENRHNAV